MPLAYSVLDLAPVAAGERAGDALRRTVELAQLGERLGFVRHWFAEHHGMPSIASAAPEILIEHAASATTRIRVGSGGILLPNHTPLRVAEVFHTLEALHPGRIDLGIGRAPGTDPITARALRPFDPDQFPEQLMELMGLSRGDLPSDHPFHTVRVVPAGVALPPIWLLGSSGATADLAGRLGVGYSFARHFSPAPPGPALAAYRRSFRPSAQFPQPHVIVGLSVICAPSDEQAEYLTSSVDLFWLRFQRGELAPLPSPEEATAYRYTPHEREIVRANRFRHVIGSPERVGSQIAHMAAEYGCDEVIITTSTYAHADRLRSYRLVAARAGLKGQFSPAADEPLEPNPRDS